MKTRSSTSTFRAKLWRYFSLFALGVLALLWVLQTVFLQAFYEGAVKASVRDAAAAIERSWAEDAPEQFAEVLDEQASTRSLLIFVAGWDRDVLYSTDEHSAAYAESDDAGEDAAAGEYSWTQGKQGEAAAEFDGADVPGWQIGQSRNIGLTEGFDEFLELLAQNPADPVEYQDSDGDPYTYGISLPGAGASGSACEVAGRDAVLYISTTLQPVGATVSVVRMQLAIATVVALVAAFALAFALSRSFSRPVEGLTRKARMLAGAGRAGNVTGAGDARRAADAKGQSGSEGGANDLVGPGSMGKAGGATGPKGLISANAAGAADAAGAPNPDDGFEVGFCAELDELAGALDDASAELSKVEEQRAEFLANISHDLRTPLTLIRGYAEAVRDDVEEGLDVDPADFDIVAREADRLGELVNDLLDYSKLKGGSAAMEMAPFDASTAFQAAADLFAPYCERIGLGFDVQVAPGITVEGDEAQLVRVVCNLIDNAVSHTPDGGRVNVRLELLGGARVSDGNTAAQDAAMGAMRFSVRDTGSGIAPDELEHVWERYFTKKQAARNARGSGLGLAISREILEAHGARYGVESELGKGSTFWFELP